MRARYWVFVVILKFYSLSATVVAVSYNGTWLYSVMSCQNVVEHIWIQTVRLSTHRRHMAVWETKFLEHLPRNKCPLYVLYKIPLAQDNFLLTQLKNMLPLASGRALVSLTAWYLTLRDKRLLSQNAWEKYEWELTRIHYISVASLVPLNIVQYRCIDVTTVASLLFVLLYWQSYTWMSWVPIRKKILAAS